MKTIDLHVDTLMRLYQLKHKEPNTKETLLKNEGHLDLKRMDKAGYLAQFFAIYLDLGEKAIEKNHYEDALKMVELFKESCNEYNSYIGQAYNKETFEEAKNKNKMAGILTIEEAGILEGDINRFYRLEEEGIKLMTLTWNYENCIGFPNYEWKYQNNGLKDFGKQLVKEMNERDVLIDVSHLSDGGFKDVLELSKKPFVASHSNARAVCNHPRNLTDEMIYQLADKGGIIGLNFAGAFLREDKLSRIEAMVRHIKHIENKGGRGCLSLGSDFDGIGGDLELKGVQDMPKLSDALLKSGYSEDAVEMIFYKNAERFLNSFWS